MGTTLLHDSTVRGSRLLLPIRSRPARSDNLTVFSSLPRKILACVLWRLNPRAGGRDTSLYLRLAQKRNVIFPVRCNHRYPPDRRQNKDLPFI